jgi:uroporphyrinogen-III synthase
MSRILITREHAEPLASRLAEAGLESIHIPLIRLVGTDAPPPEGRPDAVLVTSPAAPRFAQGMADKVSRARVVAVGGATAEALKGVGVNPRDVGDAGGIAALDMLQPDPETVCWYIGAETPSPDLDAAMDASGIVRWAVYRNEPAGVDASALIQADVAVVTFTSGSAVAAYVAAAGVPNTAVVVLGPATADVAAALGVRVAAIATTPTLESLVDAVARVATHPER